MLNDKNENTTLQKIRPFCRYSLFIMSALIMIFSLVQRLHVYFLLSIKVTIAVGTIFCIVETLIYKEKKNKKTWYLVFNILVSILCVVILILALFSC